MIEIKNLSKVYNTNGKDVVALKDINLTISDGEIYGIMGLSGAGKSSLIRCINMLEKPTSGSILINGVEMTKLKPKELRNMRKKIGMIFQHFNLLMNSTVYENIAFPLKISKVSDSAIKKRVDELLDVVDLKDKKYAYPAQLSGGQKQRVGIARALANNPDIILSDEATSALDPTTTESILNLLKDINKQYGITIVVITHEMSVIRNLCDKVAVLEDGRIIEEGNVIDIFSNPSTETSKRFLKDMIAELPPDILLDDDNPNEEVLRLSFFGSSSNQPVISHMIKNFDVEVNIISGNIERVQNSQVGNLLIKISGEQNSIKDAIKFLENNGLRIEVLKNGVI
ncbi:Phosphonate-transporting ATPase [Thermoanaerobacterium xylanolyticum LX-11]|uniref:Phosphonate-transporting ATPase n=1 Tax=Thermoanaerobacterium xylanolyticum (strain ATCC 49914 / DSM 7097 / LX-11) TaxID=858215 RepID=F6BIM6_THEXL|nr:methionine ABC transporter ATP-binding protein [Thermoanaerobacterium xylanolyticum]AEF16770.1 Phosphonate-transporting ATPase [Thermoanaerobacterium xylanolyticum LX-11]